MVIGLAAMVRVFSPTLTRRVMSIRPNCLSSHQLSLASLATGWPLQVMVYRSARSMTACRLGGTASSTVKR